MAKPHRDHCNLFDAEQSVSSSRAFSSTVGWEPIAIGDFNGDGERDVLVANDGNTGLLIGNGDATLQPPQLYNAGGPGIAIGDFNRDGRPDVAFAGTVILLNIAPRTTR